MSTKIYYGYKVNIKLRELPNFIKKIRKQFALERDFKIKSIWDKENYTKHWVDIHEICFKVHTNGTRDFPDFEANITFFINNKNIYAMTFWEMKEYTKVWEKNEEVKEYFYWDNTDMPEGISNKEWKNRNTVWCKLIPSGVPALDGFTCLIIDYMPPFPQEIWKKE